MTQITHDEARRLIRCSMDHALDHPNRSLLDAHLEECKGCGAYAGELKELGNLLLRTMQRKWNVSPTPLSIYGAVSQARSRPFDFVNAALVTRTAAIVITVLIIVFGAWQFPRTNPAGSYQVRPTALPVPTPSTYLTNTSNPFQGCDHVLYAVQSSDTLESIALQFAVSKDDIMLFNNMQTETLYPSAQIGIPLCNSTPTGTINAPASATTITPQFEMYRSTPG